MLRYLFESLEDSFFPLGHPVNMRKGENKILQLACARKVNFKVVNSLISNNSNNFFKFTDRFDTIVIKPFYINSVKKNKNQVIPLKSSINKSTKIKSTLHSDKNALFLQEPIPKIADIRITVIGDYIIPCLINTSILPNEEIDWRNRTFDFEHRIIDIPSELKIQILKFMDMLSLKSAYMDFAIDSDGNYYFIESNTNGQWLWMEIITKFKISHIVAEKLLKIKSN
jgi:glutathione synthase/RimK-type ligase-like ATP-grasp enzyme